MPGRSHSGPLPALTGAEVEIQGRLERHVWALAGQIGERSLRRGGSLDEAARYLRGILSGLGLAVEAQEFEVGGTKVVNLESALGGGGPDDEILIAGAHYDSVAGCPGANDNATGAAAVLELARLLAHERLPRTLRFVLFVNEEPPYYLGDAMGSRRYARRCRARGERIAAMLCLETIGYYSDAPGGQRYPFPLGLVYPSTGNFVGFVGNVASRDLVRRCIRSFRRSTAFPSEGVAAPGWMAGVGWSDHSSFWEQGYPAVMVTDTALFRYAPYHTTEDTPEKIRYGCMARVVAGLARVMSDLATSAAR